MTVSQNVVAPATEWAKPAAGPERPRALVIGAFPPEPGKGAALAAQSALVLAAEGYSVVTLAVSGQGLAHRVLEFRKQIDIERLFEELKGEIFDVVVIDPAAFSMRTPKRHQHLPVMLHQFRALWRLARIGRQVITLGGRVGGRGPLGAFGQAMLSRRRVDRLSPGLPLSKHRARLRRLLAPAPGRRSSRPVTLAEEAARIGPLLAPPRRPSMLVAAVDRLRRQAVPIGRFADEVSLSEPVATDAEVASRSDAAHAPDPAWSVAGQPVSRLIVHVRAALKALPKQRPGAPAAAKRLVAWYQSAGRKSAGGGLVLPSLRLVHGQVAAIDTPAALGLHRWWVDLAACDGFDSPLQRAEVDDPAAAEALTRSLASMVEAVAAGCPPPQLPDAVQAQLAGPVVASRAALSGLEFALGLLTGRIEAEGASAWSHPAARAWFAALAARNPALANFASCPGPAEADVEVIGYALQGSGLSANLAMTAQVLSRIGLPPLLRGLEVGLSRLPLERAGVGEAKSLVPLRRPLRILHLNADMVPQTLMQPSLRLRREAVNVGFLLWEFDVLPEAHKLALDMLDEAWCPSGFVADAYAAAGRVPVENVRKAVTTGPLEDADRKALGIPEGAFLFLVVFDFHSSVERKNPLAAVRAFRAAFPRNRRDVGLVIKTTEVVRGHWGDPHDQWKKIWAAAAADSRIVILTGKMPTPRYMALIAACDCVVSPHRAEGFGYAPAHAHLLARPVIVTDYSGTADFCTAETARLVTWKAKPVGRREAIYPVPGAKWADIEQEDLVAALRETVDDPQTAQTRAAAGQALMRREYSVDAQGARYRARLEALGLLDHG